MKKLLVVTALLEGVTGLALMVSPAPLVALLARAALEAPGRTAGGARGRGGVAGAGALLLAGARGRSGPGGARHRRRHVALQCGGGRGAGLRGPRVEAHGHRPLARGRIARSAGVLVRGLPAAEAN